MKNNKKYASFLFIFCMLFISMSFVSSAPNVVFSPGDTEIELGSSETWDFGVYFSGTAGAFNMFGNDQVDSLSFQIGDSYSSNTYSPSGGEYIAEAENQASDQWQIDAASETPSNYNGPYEINNVVLEACSGDCNSTDPFNVDIVPPDPDQIATPSPISMNYDEISTRDYSAIFDSNTYTVENAFFSDPIGSSSVSIGDDYASNSYSPSGNEYTITVTSGGELEIDSEQTDVSINDMTMEVCNDYNECSITNDFSVDITSSSGGGGGSTNASGLNDSIVSYYPLNESSGNVVDVAGSNDGTNNGATRGVTGKINNSFDFISSNGDYVNTNFVPSTDTSFTWSTWIKTNNSDAGNFLGSDSDNSNGFAIRVTSGVIGYFWGGGSNAIGSFSGSTSVDDGNWHLVTLTYDGSGNSDLYVDGSLDTSESHSNGYDSVDNLGLGVRGISRGADYIGKLDEVGIWNRSLNSTEVSSLYNNGNGLYYGDFTQDTQQSTSPDKLADPNNRTIGFNTQTSYIYSNYFSNFTDVNAFFQDNADAQSVQIGDSYSSNTYSPSGGDYTVNTSNDVLTITSGNTNALIENIVMESCNSNGCTSTNNFNISISGENVSKPQVLSSVADISLQYNQTETINNITSFFTNATSYDIAFSDPIDNQSVIVGNGSFSQTSYSPSGNNYTISYSNGDITVDSEQTDVSINDAELVGCNSAGCNRTNEFSIVISEDTSNGGATEQGILSLILDPIKSIFPNSDDVDTLDGVLYWIVLSFLTGVLIYIMSGGFTSGSITAWLVFTGMWFIFFTILGYIPVGILIVLLIIALAIIIILGRGR